MLSDSSQTQGGQKNRENVYALPTLNTSLCLAAYIGRKPLSKSYWEVKHNGIDYQRGDIYYAELNPVIGSEQGGTRPVLIISNDIGNKHSPTVIIAPITSRVHTKAKLPTHTLIKDFDGLDKNSIILFEQIRTIDKQRLREYLGTLDRRFIHCADKALAISIGLAKKD